MWDEECFENYHNHMENVREMDAEERRASFNYMNENAGEDGTYYYGEGYHDYGTFSTSKASDKKYLVSRKYYVLSRVMFVISVVLFFITRFGDMYGDLELTPVLIMYGIDLLCMFVGFGFTLKMCASAVPEEKKNEGK